MEIHNHSEDQQEAAGRNYIKWDDPRVEKKPPNEDEDIKAVADTINQMQKAQWNNHRHCYSGMTPLTWDQRAATHQARYPC